MLVDLIGYLAAILTLSVFYMKTMIPLRILGISANLAFIAYGALAGVYPNLVLHAVLLPLNVVRLRQMLALVRDVKQASASTVSADWLKPFMSARSFAAGEVVFRKGDVAQTMYYIVGGRFRIPEIDKTIGPGEIVGELGFIEPDQKRTRGLECIDAGRVLVITYDELRQLYFQNPAFGFYFLKIVSQRLLDDVARVHLEKGVR
jgi:CRP/FNR family cyclic AMP-dependent transcriptional regulator